MAQAKPRTLFTDKDYTDVLTAMASLEEGNRVTVELNEQESEIGDIKFPQYVLDFCVDHNLKLSEFISCLLGAFVVEMETGLSGREKYFLKKVTESNLPFEVKNEVIKILVRS